MSDAENARRTDVKITFDGADITKSIRPYLLSLTYIDNEEDETDEIQIQVQDRDGIWMEEWLNEAVEAASSTAVGGGGDLTVGDTVQFTGSYHYIASSSDAGFPARPGPAKITLHAPGSKHPWHLIHTDGTSNVYGWVNESDIQKVGSEGTKDVTSGLEIRASIIRENWNGEGRRKVLPCGRFELDSVTASGPPAVISMKGTSLPFRAKIRQTKRSKAWENYTLSGIAGEMAAANGMTCMYEAEEDPFYSRAEQVKTSDIQFLETLCHRAGISLKAGGNVLILFDQAAYEAKAPVFTIRQGDGSYTRYKLDIGTAGTQYSSCRVSCVGADGKCIEGVAKVEDYDAKAKTNQQLEVTAGVATPEEAKKLAVKLLRRHNRYEKTASFTMLGNPGLAAGVTGRLKGWGGWDGKYIVTQATHTVGAAGYITKIKLRRTLGGY